MNKQILTKINKDRHEKTKTDNNQQIQTRINKYRQESTNIQQELTKIDQKE